MTSSQKAPQIIVRSMSSRSTKGWLECGTIRLPCALGRSGSTTQKREGDGASPKGTWYACALFYRTDRMIHPQSALPCRRMRRTDGWCDAPGDRNYNRHVTHPYPNSAEHLWRDDNLYDLLITLDHNTKPRSQGCGSAIFIHIARPNYEPTEGCIALARGDLKKLLAHLRPNTRIKI